MSSTNISLQWSKPPEDPSSGVILGYNIVVLDSVTNISRNFINYTATHMSVNDLNEYHNYSVKVAAFTAAGQGRFTSWVHARTLEDGKLYKITWRDLPTWSLFVRTHVTQAELILSVFMLLFIPSNRSRKLKIHNAGMFISSQAIKDPFRVRSHPRSRADSILM